MRTTVSVLSVFLGSALNALMREDGFGSLGNAIIISGGFFLTLIAANHQGYVLPGMHVAVIFGLAGAFFLLMSLTFARALIKRI